MLNPVTPLQFEFTPGQRKVINTIRKYRSISRSQLTELTGLKSGSVTSITKELLSMNFINEGEKINVGRGQPKKPLALNEYAAFSIGVSFHINFISFGIANFTGQIIAISHLNYDESTPVDDVLAELKFKIDELIEKHKLSKARILGMGISIPGLVKKNGTIHTIESLSHWRDISLVETFTRFFQLPVWVDNDCNVAAVGEFFSGEWKDVDNLILIEVGHGVGGGIIVDGQIYRGSRANAGEIGIYLGHTYGDDKATIRQLIKQLTKAGYSLSKPSEIPSSDNPIVDQWLDKAARQLKPVLMLTAAWFDPDCIIIGGSLPRHLANELIVRIGLNQEWDELGFMSNQKKLILAPTRVGEHLNTYGACMYPVFKTLEL